MKFLIDADLPNSLVATFRDRDIEVSHVREIGMGGARRVSGFLDPMDFEELDEGVVVVVEEGRYRVRK